MVAPVPAVGDTTLVPGARTLTFQSARGDQRNGAALRLRSHIRSQDVALVLVDPIEQDLWVLMRHRVDQEKRNVVGISALKHLDFLDLFL